MVNNIRQFGTTPDGRAVQAITLQAGGIRATLLTLGAILQDVRIEGADRSLTLGSDSLADYLGPMHYFGALVGPVVNRLSGAQAQIAGRAYQFEGNQDGRITLHSGKAGTWNKLWTIRDVQADSVTLQVDLEDGDGGFPGNRTVTARFTVQAPATLRMEVTGTTDAPTLMNFANHSYWNLDGTPKWQGHSLLIAADHYTPTTEDVTPTGDVASVDGTEMDFRTARAFTPGEPALDTNFCLSSQRTGLRDVLWLTGQSGMEMTIATTEPGVQIYDSHRTNRPGQGTYEGLAIEPQCWPDAPNCPGFPSIDLAPGETYQQVTEWRFARR